MGLIQSNSFIAKLNDTDNIEEVCAQEKIFIDNNYSTIGSRKYAYSTYRKVVKENFPEEVQKIAFSYFRLSDEEAKKYKTKYREKVKFDQNNLKSIFDYKAYIAKAESLIESSNFTDNVLGFAALTGRRVAEIACTANFTLEIPKYLVFTGQLKTKGVILFDAYAIPCLTNTIKLYEAFKVFRNKYPKYLNNPRKFHDNASKDLSLKVKKHFSEYVEGEITPKDLRAIYGTITCKFYKDNNKQTDQSYIADILGHSKDDLNTCNSYFDYVIEV